MDVSLDPKIQGKYNYPEKHTYPNFEEGWSAERIALDAALVAPSLRRYAINRPLLGKYMVEPFRTTNASTIRCFVVRNWCFYHIAF